ncbi:MAG TPA: type I glyceraldehyde-3-phosphate dehydrogenase [Bacteroidia bacterium]|nr:type I glyceraldehyde-3-phosphate dehydrogenase [Bacteroidia bacterium]MBP7713987.1 type I glyceraldehyde-3-phosphate dehydrogenase [Bacteroidia bacterium]MBP8667740.1 type I glyceraldehyde-3-phosphate dehydrogenase [Bacteroidia bacterium]HQW17037.1 type I glyceraldehyde-3-phosphate dehydrogenase [Bacteroidia bacterium]HQW48438.1 type I glyceraldehyde-3-phosphate dehydrogenase [Bacteroidia bacterium]
MTRVAINGFGRIGRTVLKKLLLNKNLTIVGINDLTDPKTLAHLFKYDSIHGKFDGTVTSAEKAIIINNQTIPVYAEKDPAMLPWKDLQVDVVIESTGRFTKAELAEAHIKAGARKVIISAPGSGNLKSVVLGVNENILDGSEKIISNASCTTNNAAPMIKILQDNWGVESAYITTVHAYTGDQNIHDAPHKDLRRARAAAQSIIPTTTGAAKAVTEIFPDLKGMIGGAGIRVPVIDGSITDITCILKHDATVEAINQKFLEASQGSMKGIIEYTTDPIVSVDIIGNTHSCIFDSMLTSVLGKMVKVVGWYDNEMGYSTRLAELTALVGKQ